jgi:hypothetical protein
MIDPFFFLLNDDWTFLAQLAINLEHLVCSLE